MPPPIFCATTTRAWGRPASASASRRRRLTLFGTLALLLLPLGHVSAQLMVHPTRIVLEKNQRSAQIEIINNSNEPATYRITLVNRRMDVNGGFAVVETPAPGEQFADGMLRYSPRRATLAPGASQVVRIMTRKPADLAPGEYRSHLLFAKQPDPAGPTSIETRDSNNRGDIGVSLTALVGVSIPVIVREGDTAATVSMGNIALSKPSAGQPLVVSMDMRRSGNQSVYGDLSVSFTSAGGTLREIGSVGGVAVYAPNELRHAKLLLTLPAGMVLANGTLTASYRERIEHGGALLAEASLSLP